MHTTSSPVPGSPWRTPEDQPVVPAGGSAWFNVAVLRASSGKVIVIPAKYANDYPLCYDDPVARQGNRWQEVVNESDNDGDALATGWYSPYAATGDHDRVFEPLLGGSDELLGWQPMPPFNGAGATAPFTPTGQ